MRYQALGLAGELHRSSERALGGTSREPKPALPSLWRSDYFWDFGEYNSLSEGMAEDDG